MDTCVFLFFNGAHNEFFDYFMKAYSGKWIWVPLYATLLYVMIRNFTIKQTILCVIGLSLTIAFADQICATFIRPFVERLRPANLDNPISPMVHIVGNYRGGSYGFPSCHAANTFGLAFFIFSLFKRYWLTLFIMGWATLTCYSRIYLGVHYPGGLLAGSRALDRSFLDRHAADLWLPGAPTHPMIFIDGIRTLLGHKTRK